MKFKNKCINCEFIDLHDYDELLHLSFCGITGRIIFNPCKSQCDCDSFVFVEHDPFPHPINWDYVPLS